MNNKFSKISTPQLIIELVDRMDKKDINDDNDITYLNYLINYLDKNFK